MLSTSKHAKSPNNRQWFYVSGFLFILILFVYFYHTNSIDGLKAEMIELKINLRSIGNQSPNQYLTQKSPPLLPSIPTTAEEEKLIGDRGIYGGKGDKAHLGIFESHLFVHDRY